MLFQLGRLAVTRGDYASARAMYERRLAACREIGWKRDEAYSLLLLADLASRDGDCRAARELCIQSLTLQRELGDRRRIAACLERLAEVARSDGAVVRAVRLLGAADTLRETIGAPVQPIDRAGYDRCCIALRSTLGDEAFSATWAEGYAMPLDQAIAYALSEP
jgi:hypothetical protein